MVRYANDTLTEICKAIGQTIGRPLTDKGVMTKFQLPDELTEGMNDDHVLQIYPESESPVDASSGATHKLTFGDSDGPVIQELITIHIDYYATQRSSIADDMAALLPGIDHIRSQLKQQDCDPFDIPNCQSFQWSWERTTFSFGNNVPSAAGARFILVLRFF